MTDEQGNIKQFLEDRRSALLSMNKKTITDYCQKYGIDLPKEESVFWVAVHKARTGCTDLPIKDRKISKEWLSKMKFKSFDDGDLIN